MPAKNNITKLDQELTIVVGGQAGQGMQTLGLLLSRAFLKFGFFISTYQSYQSRIRGGHNFYQIRVSAHPITSVRSRIDILVALDQETLEQHCSHISEQGLILADTKITSSPAACVELLALDIAGLLPPAQQSEIYTTSFFAGALAGLIQLSPGIFTDILKSILVKKDEQIIADNTAVFHAGYQALVASSVWSGKYQLSPPAKKKNYLNLHGNQAIALGAIAAGCKFYSAYPMTPATSIFETLAKWAAKTGMVVEQAEDEIAALNMVLGASYAGVRAMTGTSGGGFALMVEAVSLAGMTECPAVIVNAQRPGPATGLPTRTEQGDLEMVIYAGHGEFPRVVLTPGNHQQCFTLTMLAFNLAEQYQIPVMVLTDQYLADLYSNISVAELNPIAIERGKVVTSEAGYQRYAFSEDGISPRAFPGQGTG
ncbi:2-oxoacid:acceptor oxidoreductase subunit alpha, partial [bacterium]|nr:2-oxoacid:acceptor oxidoreductase subunit alpha [bacterium]